MFELTVEIPSDLIEPVYEHVHHGKCFSLLERGRLALLERIGFPNEELLAQGRALVITRVEAHYKREVKGACVIVTCESPTINGRSLVLRQRILNERGKTAVEAVIESVFMDMGTRRGMDIPGDFRDAFLRWASVDTAGSLK